MKDIEKIFYSNTACGSGATGDCQTCGILAGASVNGTCEIFANGTNCNEG